MPITLFISVYPGDAIMGAGALLASLPQGRTYHASVFPAVEFATSSGDGLKQQNAALDLLDVHHLGEMAATPESGGLVTDKQLQAHIAALLSEYSPDAVLLPLGLGQRLGDRQLSTVALRLRQEFTNIRWLQYFDQPFVAYNRGKYPELAFARRVRGFAEVDEDASMFNWKAVGSLSPQDPLARKIHAVAALQDLVAERFYREQEFEVPVEAAAIHEHIARVLGQREWLRLLQK